MAFPLTSVLDTFNRADGAIGANWSNDPLSDGSPVAATIASNQWRCAGYSEMWWNPSTFVVPLEVWAVVGARAEANGAFNGFYMGFLQQASAASNTADGYIVAWHCSPGGGADQVEILRTDNTTNTSLVGPTNLGSALAAADVIGLSLDAAGRLDAWVNGISVANATSTTYFNGGQAANLFQTTVDTGAFAIRINDFGGGTGSAGAAAAPAYVPRRMPIA